MTDQTITAEQIEKAAGGMWDLYGKPGMFPYAPDHLRTAFLKDARAAFRAAGFRVEGDET
ncbi:hypothetical protein [Nesterenkonia sp. K-15-9-6]|uniref:hypothetical protein n=1 Tax=Nesterenkonia sp. K-15-9-6 TaxID=3093918 RepID=UPI004044C59E